MRSVGAPCDCSCMATESNWPEMDGRQWAERMDLADKVAARFAASTTGSEHDEELAAQAYLASLDPTAYVGSRHHTVPAFVLKRWADRKGKVQVYRRVEASYGQVNIRDLAIRDFYTVIDLDGAKNSHLESLMGRVESIGRPVIEGVLNPFVVPRSLGAKETGALAHFASIQSVRTTRRRREVELHADWYAKTMAQGVVSDAKLRQVSIVPHQNETIAATIRSADELFPFFACRPLAIIHLDAPLLLMCDEPVILNAPVGAFHLEDCFLTDKQIAARRRRARKAAARSGADVPEMTRTVHFSSTKPSGHGTADEIVLAISPRAALLWGPLGDSPRPDSLMPERLTGDEARRFADMANEAMCAQALDWIIAPLTDQTFKDRAFPEPGPLMRVCDGANAAAAAVNSAPTRYRPHRLWVPEETDPQ